MPLRRIERGRLNSRVSRILQLPGLHQLGNLRRLRPFGARREPAGIHALLCQKVRCIELVLSLGAVILHPPLCLDRAQAISQNAGMRVTTVAPLARNRRVDLVGRPIRRRSQDAIEIGVAAGLQHVSAGRRHQRFVAGAVALLCSTREVPKHARRFARPHRVGTCRRDGLLRRVRDHRLENVGVGAKRFDVAKNAFQKRLSRGPRVRFGFRLRRLFAAAHQSTFSSTICVIR